jgi:hypothetical protein
VQLQAGMALPRVAAFRVLAAEHKGGQFLDRVGVRLYACDGLRQRPEEVTAAEREALHRILFPMLHSHPFQVRAAHGLETRMVGDRQVLFAHAPSELHVRLPPGRHVVTGAFGIEEAADCPTDGVSFRIVRRSAGEATTLFERLLQPLSSPGDRGLQTFRVEVESTAEAVLVLIADPGPAQDNRCDWSWWTDVRIEPK